jgi:hypothetical protein
LVSPVGNAAAAQIATFGRGAGGHADDQVGVHIGGAAPVPELSAGYAA